MARLSIKIDKDQAKRLANALDLIEAHVASVRPDLARLTPANRQSLLEKSPILKRALAIGGSDGLH